MKLSETSLESSSSAQLAEIPQGVPDPAPVNAFLVYNEAETPIDWIDDWLRAHGISTHYFRRDVPIGEPVDESYVFSRADTAVVFLGRAGWGPSQRSLVLEARETKLPILPVLIGNPPDGALDDVGGLFRQQRYVNLQDRDPAKLNELRDQILRFTGPRDAEIDKVIADLIKGQQQTRQATLDAVRLGLVRNKAALATRLRAEIAGSFSVESEKSGSSAKHIASVRSWMLSALVWCDRENPLTRQILYLHADPLTEPNSHIRYWILAGAYQSQASYLAQIKDLARSDLTLDVVQLVNAINPIDKGQVVTAFRAVLLDGDSRDVNAVVRALRVVPYPELVPELCALLLPQRVIRLHFAEILMALSHPTTAPHAAPMLSTSPGIAALVKMMVDSSGVWGGYPPAYFSPLLSALDQKLLITELRKHLDDPAKFESAQQLLNHLSSAANDGSTSWLRVAGYSSDSISTQTDQLGIGAEVKILTAIMLAKDVAPPLAIGLFGDWGSGKSFFMRTMRESAARLASQARESNGDSNYCSKVVQIEFNAWHYADTNLWASLAAFILDSLAARVAPQDKVKKDTVSPSREAMARALAEAEAAKVQKAVATERLELESELLHEVQQQRRNQELTLTDLKRREIVDLIANTTEVQSAFRSVALEAGWKESGDKEKDFAEITRYGKGLFGRAKALFAQLSKPGSRKITLALAALLVVLPAAAYWLPLWFAWFAGTPLKPLAWFVELGVVTVWMRKGMRVIEQTMAKIEYAKHQLERAREEKRKVPTQAEATLSANISVLKAEEEHAAARLNEAAARVLEMETRVAELKQKKSLSYFLSERTKSDDYRKHLGIISTLRSDFEALASRLDDPDLKNDANGVDRIVLYIDDLDRCPAAKVVDVLQAVHLLLAYPLFVVVVGVDSRWLLHSLTTHYRELGGSAETGVSATPQQYLEKIFQIPYALEPMSAAGYGRLIGQLMGGQQGRPPAPPAPTHIGAAPDHDAAAPLVTAPVEDAAAAVSVGEPTDAPSGIDHRGIAQERAVEEASKHPRIEVEEDALLLQPWEASFAASLHALIPSPRAAKRLSNIYRILKARVPMARVHNFEGTAELPGQFQIPLLLLAVLINDSGVASNLFAELLTDRTADATVVQMLRGKKKNVIGSAERSLLLAKIEHILQSPTFPTDPELLFDWVPQVWRFSFDLKGRPKDASVA